MSDLGVLFVYLWVTYLNPTCSFPREVPPLMAVTLFSSFKRERKLQIFDIVVDLSYPMDIVYLDTSLKRISLLDIHSFVKFPFLLEFKSSAHVLL